MSSDTTSSKILTDDYCKWHANLVDKIRSRLYKAYMEETGLDPWIKSETSESSQTSKAGTAKKDANNYIPQDSLLETQVRIPQINVQPTPSKLRSPISILPKDPEEKQKTFNSLIIFIRFPCIGSNTFINIYLR